jgi:hypothetical protein
MANVAGRKSFSAHHVMYLRGRPRDKEKGR